VPAPDNPPEIMPPPETVPSPASPTTPVGLEPPVSGSTTVIATTVEPGPPPTAVAGPPKPADSSSSSPTKVRIDTPGASIEIEANESLAEVVATALRLFHEAGGWPQVNSRSAGFAQAERRETYPVQPSSMPYGPGSYPVQLP